MDGRSLNPFSSALVEHQQNSWPVRDSTRTYPGVPEGTRPTEQHSGAFMVRMVRMVCGGTRWYAVVRGGMRWYAVVRVGV